MATTKKATTSKSKTTKKTTITKKTATKVQTTTTKSTKPKSIKSASSVLSKDTKILCICESPNKKATLTKIFKDLGYKNASVEASVGHITEIKNNSRTKWNTGIHVDDNFKIDYVVSDDKKKVVATLKEKVKSSEIVLLASDPDREGEAIATHLKQELKIPESKYYRLTFHEITKSGVLTGLEELGKIDINLSDAAEARAGADKFIGYSLSGLGKKAVGARSVGRVQSPALKILVDREQEIRNFVPEKYWELYLDFEKNSHSYRAKYVGTESKPLENGRFKKEEDAQKVIEECTPYSYLIHDIESKDRVVSPKPPFTTSTLQQECSSKLGISVKQTAMFAQKLFEGISVNGTHVGLITYIRTDSSEMSPEFALELGQFVRATYGEDYFAPVRKGKKQANEQDGHECIRVVDLSMTPDKLAKHLGANGSADDNKKMLKVYEIIYNRTVAASMAPAIITDTDYNIFNLEHHFVYTSHAVKFEGFLKVYSYKDDDEEEFDAALQDLNEGDIIKQKDSTLTLEAKETKPPRRYSEAGLVAALEKLGIGRPSTYPTIISTLTDKTRNYTTTENKVLIPTQLGEDLTGYLDKNFSNVVGINYTAELETELDKIAQGEMTKLDFFQQFYDNLVATIEKVDKDAAEGKSGLANLYCPLCRKPLVWRKGPYGNFLGCTGWKKDGTGCNYISKGH